MTRLSLSIALLTAVGACSGDASVDSSGSSEEVEAYLNRIAPILVSRLLTPGESAAVALLVKEQGAMAAIETTLGTWKHEPGLKEAARELIQTQLSASGATAEINYELPGNLAALTVANDAPWSTLVLADYCVDDNLEKIPCDSGSPENAGVLTTRAYLAGRASRFNLTRASTLLSAFLCHHYPLEDDMEPPVARERLRTMFQANTPEEQEDPEAAAAFGNGFGCYSCHSQFAWHSQLFVKFDEKGLYRPDATGMQDPMGELGRSPEQLFASHFSDPLQAMSPASQMLGVPVENLRQAGLVLGQSEEMRDCMTRNVLDYGLGLNPGAEVNPQMLAEISADLDPLSATFSDYVVAAFSNRRVFQAVLEGVIAPTAEGQPEPTEDMP